MIRIFISLNSRGNIMLLTKISCRWRWWICLTMVPVMMITEMWMNMIISRSGRMAACRQRVRSGMLQAWPGLSGPEKGQKRSTVLRVSAGTGGKGGDNDRCIVDWGKDATFLYLLLLLNFAFSFLKVRFLTLYTAFFAVTQKDCASI